MNKIAVLSDPRDMIKIFEGEQYIIDLDRELEEYDDSDLVCFGFPFRIPLKLKLAIKKDGTFSFICWEWDTLHSTNHYFHTYAKADNFPATPEQIDTVNGLFSGRIRFEGLMLAIGATIQEICPINKEREEQLIGKKIYLA